MATYLSQMDTATKSEEGIWCDIYYEGVKSGIQIKIKGPDSKAYKANALALRKYIQKHQEKKADINQDEMDEKSFQLLAAVTCDWQFVEDDGTVIEHNIIMNEKGEKLPYNTENAVMVYSGFSFVADQVMENLTEKANFLHG